MDLETCRICASSCADGGFVDIFQPTCEEDLQNELYFIIDEMNAWQLNIAADDGLPQRICSYCFAKFSTIYAFRKECEKAQMKLREAVEEQKSDNTLDFAKQYLEESKIDSNGNIIKYFAPSIENNVSLDSSDLIKFNVDAPVEPAELAIVFDISYDENVPSNFVIKKNVSMAAAASQTTPKRNAAAAMQEIETDAEIKTVDNSCNNFFTEDLEEMLGGSIIPKNINIEKSGEVDRNLEDINHFNTIIDQTTKTDAPTIAKSTLNGKGESTDDEYEQIDEKPAQRIANFSFACNYCYCPPIGPIGHLIFKNNDALSQHFFDVHDPKLPYPCPKCPKLFASSRRRNNHFSKTHGTREHRIVRCPYCRKGISTPTEIHEITCSYISDWRCKVCDRHFRQMPLHSFRTHQRSHYSNPKFRCEICKIDFMRQSNLESHQKIHLEYCVECKKHFSTTVELRKHNISVHGTNLFFRCKYCDKGISCNATIVEQLERFFSSASLHRHTEYLHKKDIQKGSKSATCSNCKVTFPSKARLIHHQQRPKDENGQCILQFPHKSQSRYFCCPHCSKRFTSKNLLDFHIELHEIRLRPFECKKCMVQCRSALELEQHMNILHPEGKTFPCDKCDQHFAYEKDLENHKFCHSKLSFKCSVPECESFYTDECELSEHIRLNHELVKCECCNQPFTRNELKAHQNSVACATNMNSILRVNRNSSGAQTNCDESAMNFNHNKVFVQFINDQTQVVDLKETNAPTEQIQEKPIDYLQTSKYENSIHAADVPMDADDYFISSLLDPDNEIVVT